MAQLIFFEDGHIYEIDGEVYPSVSEVIRFISREIYGDINQYNLDHAADRGTRVHKAVEVLDKYHTVECDDDITSYIKAYVQFLKDHKPEWGLIEKAMFHPEKKYAGTLDRAGKMDGKNIILDVKTSYTVHKPLVKAQLNGYADMYETTPERHVDGLYCLHLKPDGTYRLIEFERDSTEFNACYALHKALEKKRRNNAKVQKGAEGNKSG